jgi:hypothetical protein
MTETPTDEPVDNETETPTDSETDNASVTFSEPVFDGTNITVDSVTVPDGGFIAIHDSSLLDGEVIGSVIGASAYLEPGTHDNVSVTLFNVSGATFDDTSLTEGDTLIAMPHLDTNDNETYDFVATDGEADGPYVADGEAIVDSGVVTIGGVGLDEESGTSTDDGTGLDEESGTPTDDGGDNETGQ